MTAAKVNGMRCSVKQTAAAASLRSDEAGVSMWLELAERYLLPTCITERLLDTRNLSRRKQFVRKEIDSAI
jgi:hypothetical protein